MTPVLATLPMFSWPWPYLQRPDGSVIQPVVEDNGDGTFTVSYIPDDLGTYKIDVKFGGKKVPNAPFKVKAVPCGDASKCVITGKLL